MSLQINTIFISSALILLSGCSSTATPTFTSLITSSPTPTIALTIQPNLPIAMPSLPPDLTASPPTTSGPAKPIFLRNEREGHALLEMLLPNEIPERDGWKEDIFAALYHLKLPYTAQNFCAVIAIAEQESSYAPDPITPNLSAIVWGEIEAHRKKYLIPSFMVDAALLKASPDGRSYKTRINTLRTKKQMNALYEDMIRELPFGQQIFEHKNPIRDAGPMQVSVAFAETHIRAWPYPYSYKNLRDEVFTRRGSVYFGSAIMLQYPANYSDMIFRFADYNAGRYSSRNAAFQAALSNLTGKKLAQDGDLMLYQNKMERIFSGEASEVQRTLIAIQDKLHLSSDEIVNDLKQEKLASFTQTALYIRLFEQANQKAGKHLSHEAIPQIVLVSPKITHHLTTEWFAHKVDGRYQACLGRSK